MGNDRPAAATIVEVPLPLEDDALVEQLRRAVDRSRAATGETTSRPTIVLEFRATAEGGGEGSRFEAALAVARYLASDELGGVRTVAFVPGVVRSHALLPILACEQLVVSSTAELGGLRGDEAPDAIVRAAYVEMAQRRRTLPGPVVLGMLDRSLQVSRVTLSNLETRYVLADELTRLQGEGQVVDMVTVKRAGETAAFTGRDLRQKYGFASHLADDRTQLADVLGLGGGVLQPDALARGPKAVLIELRGRLTGHAVLEAQRELSQAAQQPEVGLVCLALDSPGGSPAEALRLANFLASPELKSLKTVAFVAREARSVAGIVALACDELVVSDEARLGGPGDTYLNARVLDDLRAALPDLVRQKGRDWSLVLAMADPELPVFRYTREGTGEVRYFCEEEKDEQADPGQWQRGTALELQNGFTGQQALEWNLARHRASNPDELRELLHVAGAWERIDPHPVIGALQRLAMQPWFARTMLFIAFFALITEASTPGVGVPGFISAVSFLLFFWSQFLNGTAGWLEVLLFLGGLICLVLELFVLPGFGVFGVGGLLMIMLSIVLASQTFVIPRNSYQLDRVPNSLMMVLIAGGGVLASAWIMRRYLEDAPLLRHMLLKPPDDEERDELAQREAVVNWSHLSGKRGTTMTPLIPAGKARFGDDDVDVISDGELVPRGVPVRVVEVLGNRIVVQRLDTSA